MINNTNLNRSIKMKNQQRMFQLIKQTDGRNSIVAVPRLFIGLTGDHKAAILLSQLLYWSDKGKRKDGFIFKSDKEWGKELGFSRNELIRIRKILEPFLEIKVKKAYGSPTHHYRLKMNVLEASINEYIENKHIRNTQIERSETLETIQTLTESTQQELPKKTTCRSDNFNSQGNSWRNRSGGDDLGIDLGDLPGTVMRLCGCDHLDDEYSNQIIEIANEMKKAENEENKTKNRSNPEYVKEILESCASYSKTQIMTADRIIKALRNEDNYQSWWEEYEQSHPSPSFKKPRIIFTHRAYYVI
jgi:hypothetical protein